MQYINVKLDLSKWHKSNRKMAQIEPRCYRAAAPKKWHSLTETTGTITPKYVAQIEPEYPDGMLFKVQFYKPPLQTNDCNNEALFLQQAFIRNLAMFNEPPYPPGQTYGGVRGHRYEVILYLALLDCHSLQKYIMLNYSS